MTELDKKNQPVQENTPAQSIPGAPQMQSQTNTSISVSSGPVTPLSRVDTTEMENNMRAINEAAYKQQNAQVDNAMRQEADALRRAEREAAAQYEEQRRQTNLAERQAMDNSALYAEARGDRGGVGQAQYNSVQANAANNRAQIQQARTKMASEVTRQIADLRRQGEFKKADALLSLSQQYLSQLNDLNRWATETNLTVDQANNALRQWQMNFEQAERAADLNKALAEAEITGMYNGEKTFAAQQAEAAAAQAQKEFELNKALSEAGLTGVYNGQQTLAAQQAALEKALAEAGITGMYNGQQTLDAQKFAADQAYRDQQMAMAQKEFDFNKALSEAGLTGMYNGQQTLEAQKMAADQAYREQQAALEKALAEAGLTGMYNGQQTLEAQKMAADQAYRDQQAALEKALAEAGLTGMYNGQQTLDAQKQAADLAYREQQAALEKALAEAGLTGMYNGQQTLDAQKQAADQAYRDQQMALAQQEFAYSQNRDAVADAQNAAKTNASLGWSALEGGMMPSADQLSAMGLTTAQAQQYINDARAIAEATAAAQKIGDNSKVAALGWTALEAGIVPSAEQLAAMGVSAADAQAYINRNRQDAVIGTGSNPGNTSGNNSSVIGAGQVGANSPNGSNPQGATDKETLTNQGYAALNSGKMPSAEQLSAMGWTQDKAQAFINSKNYVDQQMAQSKPTTQTGSSSRTDSNGNVMNAVNADQMLNNTQSNIPIHPSAPAQTTTTTTTQSKPSATTPTQSTPANASLGITDPRTREFITPASPSVASIRTDANGNTVYVMKDGRILTEVKTATGSYIATSGSATAAGASGTASGTGRNTTPSKYANNAVKE